jgi:hypothetical protein
MPKRGKSGKRASPPAAAYAPVLKTGFQATASRVQEMHHAIAGKTFDNLQRFPGLATPTRIVRGVHDAITNSVYAAVRFGGGTALTLAGEVERRVLDPERAPRGAELSLRSVLNAAIGDMLQTSGSTLAVSMGFHSAHPPLPLTVEALAGLGRRLCVFVHGLACDEQSWLRPCEAWGDDTSDYGLRLARELGMASVYLRYNTGLPIAENGRQLAFQLEQLMREAPQVRELVLIGHSMGGLVARSARSVAVEQGLAWSEHAPMLICLGSPHQGAPLEKLGYAVAGGLAISNLTEPLGRIANLRSKGIKDLRHGVAGQDRVASTLPDGLALRFIAGSLADEAGGLANALVGKLLGDGLVRSASASDEGLNGDVQRVELAGLGHMALLNHPRVYAVLRGWLSTPSSEA